MYLDNYPSLGANASGFMGGIETCPQCLDATEIMLEKCAEQSYALAVTRQDADFGKDGKVILTEEHYGELKKFYYDGKMTPTNARRTRKKFGGEGMFYYLIKRDQVRDFYNNEDCNISKDKLYGHFAEQFSRWMDVDFIQKHLAHTAAANQGCKECSGSLFSDIGTDEKPFEIKIPKGATAGTTAFDEVAVQFYQYLINVSSIGDNLPNACDGQKYIFINSCFKPIVSYIEKSILANCERTCAMPDSLKPMTMPNHSLPHIYFSKNVPMTTVNGNQVSDVLAGYYGDDVMKPSPVYYRQNKEGKYSAEYDYVVYRYQDAFIRPDRKWTGKLLLRAA